MIYRLATAEDAERLANLRWDHKSEDDPLDPAGKPDFVRACAEHLRQRLGDDLHCWVADEGGLVVAHIYVVIVRKVPKPSNPSAVWGYVTAVRTVPERRNQGVGGVLMEHVIAWSRERRLEEMIVWPSERSVPFYERAGFKGENEILELLFEWSP